MALLLGGPARADSPDEAKLPPPAARAVDFVKDVRPILSTSCYSCHGPEKHKSNFRLDVKSVALTGGEIGVAIVPGKSADSTLIQYTAGLDEDMLMPPKGKKLSPEQIGILRAWIDQGAIWPDSADAAGAKAEHWSFKPATRPAVPAVEPKNWVRNPIDAFVLQRLNQQRLTPSPEADRRTLIRRVCFDLTGLPPTPAEVEAFVSDARPDAYEHLVDRLLASPRYGERWAGHWIDVVHFAETHGNDQDRIRPNAWPYRDYLIRSFNEDKPYGRFIEEQLAGDALFPDDPQATVALGFIGAGPWDESSQMSIQDGTVDKLISRNLDRDDMLMTTMSTFVSSTVHCARCHDHKFDPIAQSEYYNLQSCFAGVDRADRTFDEDPKIHQQRIALANRKKELDRDREGQKSSLLDPALQASVSRWEQSLPSSSPQNWAVLTPSSFSTTDGTVLVQQPDGSLLATAKSPETDNYTVIAHTELKEITGIRVEVMSDDSLVAKGPGRAVNGNFHLTELKVFASPARSDTPEQAVELQNGMADVDQSGWPSSAAIDHNPQTGWGVDPAEGRSHFAVFETKQPVGFVGGTELNFVMEQHVGRQHTMGRVRISVTTDKPPLRVTPAPPEIMSILAIAPPQRSDVQRIELAVHFLKRGIDEQLAALPKPSTVYAGASDFVPNGNFVPPKGCRAVFVLKRGDVTQPGDAAVPGALSCVQGLTPKFDLADANDEASRRAAFAKWLADPKNVLTWRSIVNRVWHYHFGKGIVDTPNDFGVMGGTPSHPELLDWLATWFQDQGGSLKSLHRLMLTSSTYRQSAAHNAEYAKIDADNRLLWRMNRARLDAESVHDSLLQITGMIDLTMGGPSVRQFILSPGKHVTPDIDYVNFSADDPANFRRSVYRFLFRTLPDPFMESMDCPDLSQLTPVRSTSVTALQALAMLNDKFIVRQCEHLADQVTKTAIEPSAQINAVYVAVLNRPATPKEIERLSGYAQKYGLANVCRLVLNSNEFMFVN